MPEILQKLPGKWFLWIWCPKFENTEQGFVTEIHIPWVYLVWEKHYNGGKLPNHIKRGSFWSRDVLKLLDKYKGMAAITVLEDGKTCYLWTDLWAGQVPCQSYPELFSFARRKNVRIHSAKQMEQLDQYFHLPLYAAK